LRRTYAAVAAKVSNGLAIVVYDTKPKKKSIKAVIVPSFALPSFKLRRIHIGTINITCDDQDRHVLQPGSSRVIALSP
jgi:hypothetical protein